jgi:hypothetical protein
VVYGCVVLLLLGHFSSAVFAGVEGAATTPVLSSARSVCRSCELAGEQKRLM